MAKLQSDLILSLQDRVSGPARRIDQNLENLRREQMRSQEMFNHHRNVMVGTAVAAYALARSLSEPVQASTRYSTILEDIRQTAGATHSEIAALGKSYRQAGLDTAQGYEQIARANAAMIASGAVTKEQAQIMDDFAGRAATAYGADIVDIANTQTSIVQNLGVEAEDTALALDRLSTAGKLGAFELPDMASEYAATASQAAVLKMHGVDAAGSIAVWLQIARKGKSTGAEAATAMRGFMSALVMPNTAKRFAADNVDIIGEIARAAENGVDPIEHVVGILNRLTGGDQTKLTKYFREEGALSFAQQATKRLEEYRAMMLEVNAAQGTVQTDFNDRMKTPGAINARFWASMDELQLVVGNSLVPSLTRFVTEVTPMIDSLSGFVEANDELVAAMIQTAGALVALRLMSSAGGMLSAMLGMNRGGSGSASNGGKGSSSNGGLNGPGGSRGGKGLGWWSFFGFNAIGVAQDYLEAGATMKLRPEGMSNEDWAAQTKPGTDALAAQNAAIQQMFLDWKVGSVKPIQYLSDRLLDAHQPGIAGLNTGPTQGQIDALKAEIATLDAEIAEWPEDGMEARRAGLATKLAQMQANFATASGALTSEMSAVMNRLRVIAGSGVNIPLRVNGPQVSPVVTRASIAGARASGGPVRGGSTYEINELGQEYFTPGSNGFVHKAGSFQPPGMPSFGGGHGGGMTVGTQSFSFEINLSNPTNADPRTISRMLGDEVANLMRASHSNGAM